MDQKQLLYVLAGVAVGWLLAKGGKVSSAPSASNEITQTGDWWTYAGSWA